ncbi:interferon-inducible double-stranded RNA-dependent protein kinase activator A homolog isoform X1 [Lepeophtheirus salmonis]|uniref:interferon-inducible double-stranded RNA-dependent protein kinase activator A homolog isoform X1 n=2 Tax=Lepeophtheirus salmonis TaxID=72036 RepID=UPI001AE9F622|nr:interferon-inducible double-stranded RNA-dependent protein kinase activator A-like isoform X1 [Lepeophtheirus salmonis]
MQNEYKRRRLINVMDGKLLRDHNSPSPHKDSNSHLNDVTFGPAIKRGALPFNCLVAKLHLYLSQYKLASEFILESQEGTPHNPLFHFLLKVNGEEYRGSGHTKKLAKNDAAKSFFDRNSVVKSEVVETEINNIALTMETSSVKDEYMSTIHIETPINVNYVGNLHEMCAKWSFPAPEYEFKEEMASNKIYIARCKVGDKVTEGQNSVKKEAKKMASMKMIEMIESSLRGGSPISSLNTSVSESKPIIPKETLVTPEKKVKLVPLDSAGRKEIACFQKILTKSEDLHNFLMETNIFDMSKVDYTKFLFDISKVHEFQIAYDFQVTETESQNHLCIAQLGVFPVIVIVGLGSNKEESQNMASRNALLYLKAILR